MSINIDEYEEIERKKKLISVMYKMYKLSDDENKRRRLLDLIHNLEEEVKNDGKGGSATLSGEQNN